MRLCYVLVLTCKILPCIKLCLPCIIQKPKCNSITILTIRTVQQLPLRPTAHLFDCCRSDLPFAFRAAALQTILLHVDKQSSR